MSNNNLPAQQAQTNGMIAQFNQNAGMPASINAGSVSIESERAIAEARGQMQLSKMFPRDLTKAHSELMVACKSKSFAGAAFYSVPRAGGAVTGPSIRLAEEIARVVGNFQYGHRELSRDDHKSEIEVFAWDVENNNRSLRQLTVMHVIDTKQGPRPCRDQKDIDDKISNVASKQVRGRILALIPKWLLEDAILECRRTLTGNNDEPLEVRVRKMTQAFIKYGVNVEHLEAYLGHKVSDILVDELVDLQGVYNALKEGAKPSEYFNSKDESDADDDAANIIKNAAKTSAKASAPQNSAPTTAAKKAAAPAAAQKRKALEPEVEQLATNGEVVEQKTVVNEAKAKKDPEPELEPEPEQVTTEAATTEQQEEEEEDLF
jgi:hypothetical protein